MSLQRSCNSISERGCVEREASRADDLRRNRQVDAHDAVFIKANAIGPLDLGSNQRHRCQKEAPRALSVLDGSGLVCQPCAHAHMSDASRMHVRQLIGEFTLPAIRHPADTSAQQHDMLVA